MMLNIRILLGIALAAFLALGCNNPAAQAVNVNSVAFVSPTDYGNGVYYFNARRSDFGNQLSAFMESHPQLEVVAITGDGTGSYGVDRGYFIVFRERVRAQ